MDEIVKFKPDYLIVSLGFDTFCEDPISSFKLSEAYYETMANIISTRCSAPCLVVGEGGYAVDKLGNLSLNFLKGWATKW